MLADKYILKERGITEEQMQEARERTQAYVDYPSPHAPNLFRNTKAGQVQFEEGK